MADGSTWTGKQLTRWDIQGPAFGNVWFPEGGGFLDPLGNEPCPAPLALDANGNGTAYVTPEAFPVIRAGDDPAQYESWALLA